MPWVYYQWWPLSFAAFLLHRAVIKGFFSQLLFALNISKRISKIEIKFVFSISKSNYLFSIQLTASVRMVYLHLVFLMCLSTNVPTAVFTKQTGFSAANIVGVPSVPVVMLTLSLLIFSTGGLSTAVTKVYRCTLSRQIMTRKWWGRRQDCQKSPCATRAVVASPRFHSGHGDK